MESCDGCDDGCDGGRDGGREVGGKADRGDGERCCLTAIGTGADVIWLTLESGSASSNSAEETAGPGCKVWVWGCR
jgi:hypothetical protein